MSESNALKLGMPVARFLSEYWQRKPLLIRQALPGFKSPIDGDDLAGLSCEEIALARMVHYQRDSDSWQLRSGPFEESDFDGLSDHDWTLLVQDVDKLLPDHVGPLLQAFRFIPDWRLDDIMVSFAADGGSVGPHLDQYDVFLLQAQGKRRWMIDDRDAPDTTFRSDSELKLLQHFAPNQEWLLEPGDMLYLPPGVPHHGVAEGPCLTFSIGMRAPSVAELLLDRVEDIADRLPEDLRYRDPPLTAQDSPAEIRPEALDAVRDALRAASDQDPQSFADWFGRFITRYRSAQTAMPPEHLLDAETFSALLKRGHALWRNPWSRLAFVADGDKAQLFVSGDSWASSRALAELLSRSARVPALALQRCTAQERATVLELINAGHYGFADD